jgi:phosphatidylglycerol phospholipase C
MIICGRQLTERSRRRHQGAGSIPPSMALHIRCNFTASPSSYTVLFASILFQNPIVSALPITSCVSQLRPISHRLQINRGFASADHMRTMAKDAHESDPLLARLPSHVAVPPMLLQPGAEQLVAPAQLSPTPSCSQLDFIQPHLTASKRKRPQCIAHRGYKAKHPENTMGAFRGAVNAGAHAIETDLQVTKDDVVVLSHDSDLKRCFGQDIKIADKNWEDIKDYRTVQKPHERLPQLADLLHYLAEEGREHIWLFLDIKLSNDAEKIMRLIASTLASVPSQKSAPWNNRVVLGLWATKYLPPAQKYLPGFPMMHIAFSVTYARQFFEVANVGFNMMFYALLMPGGKRFLRDAQDIYKRKMLSWTVNSEDSMKWCIRKGLDGVVTDEVELYLDVAERFDEATEKEPWLPVSLKIIWAAVKAYIWVRVLLVFYSRKMGLEEVYGGVKKQDGKQKP